MSFLHYLLEDEIPDWQLLHDVEQLESEYFGYMSDSQLVQDIEIIEQREQMWSGMSDSQCVHTVENAEEKFFDHFDISNSQLLSDVSVLEQQQQQNSARLPLGYYQGLAKPVPTLCNEAVVLPMTSKTSCQPNFDLGFCFDSSNSDEDTAVTLKVPEPVPEVKKIVGGKLRKPVRLFKHPWSDEEMKMMGQKQFAQEMYKKMC